MYQLRRADRAVTDMTEIAAILGRCEIGHLGLATPDGPYVVPLHFGFEVVDDTTVNIYFHCAPAGRKLDAIAADPNVCFEVSSYLELIGENGPVCMLGAAYESVIGFGTASVLVAEADRRHGTSLLVERYAPGRAVELPPQLGRGVQVVRVTLAEVTGKRRVAEA
ncbi:MAG: pyridoxamine 5'-phosphate oxidase family protein [Propionibacteriaceae bacterium]|jgi:nitroimidazol reductase NimA-like FMN-containing flavoprotein (pyridoxamine 5'-phosphate oxidase superfamily)|nr:pyridoxamine 5'-phosphate oxidase family protein [Propionibacteriaceae bacterium]